MIDRKYEKFLRDPDERKTISEIAYDLGFENMSYFSRLFRGFEIPGWDKIKRPCIY